LDVCLDFEVRVLTPSAKQNIAVFDRFYNSLHVALMFFFGHTFPPKKAQAKFYAERVASSIKKVDCSISIL